MKALAIALLSALLLASPSSASVGNGGGRDDDDHKRRRKKPAFSISDGHDAATTEGVPVDGVTEGGSCAFLITLKRGRVKESSVSWTTRDGSALAGSDYATASGELVLNLNGPQERIFVQTLTDATTDPNESFFVVLDDQRKAKIGDGRGECVVHDASGD